MESEPTPLEDEAWQELRDPNTGRLYYWNSVTKKARWAKPKCLLKPGERRFKSAEERGLAFLDHLAPQSPTKVKTRPPEEEYPPSFPDPNNESLNLPDISEHLKQPSRSARIAANPLSRRPKPPATGARRRYGIVVFGPCGALGTRLLVELAAATAQADISWAAAGQDEVVRRTSGGGASRPGRRACASSSKRSGCDHGTGTRGGTGRERSDGP